MVDVVKKEDEVKKDEVKKDDVVVDDATKDKDPTDDGDGEQPNLFDAVSDAIDEQTVGLDTSADDDPPTGDTDDVKPADKSKDDPEEDPEDEGGDNKPKPDKSADGEGDPEPKDGDKTPVPGADKSGDADEGAKDGADGEAAQPDHVNDPIPKELAEKTQERIRSLAERTKVAEAAVTERSADLDEMISMVQETGTSGEQYGQVLGFMKLFNSTDEADQRAAFKVMQTELATMAAKLGEPVPGVDPLAAHADLQAEVEAGTLTGDRAMEIANIRAREKASEARTVTNSTEVAAQSDIDQAIVDAKAELAVFEKSKLLDPQWTQKKAILVPALRAVMRTIHPSLWKSTFEESYNKLQLPKVAAPTPKPKTPEPLRPKTPAGEGKKEPSTMAEAIEQSLGGDIGD